MDGEVISMIMGCGSYPLYYRQKGEQIEWTRSIESMVVGFSRHIDQVVDGQQQYQKIVWIDTDLDK